MLRLLLLSGCGKLLQTAAVGQPPAVDQYYGLLLQCLLHTDISDRLYLLAREERLAIAQAMPHLTLPFVTTGIPLLEELPAPPSLRPLVCWPKASLKCVCVALHGAEFLVYASRI